MISNKPGTSGSGPPSTPSTQPGNEPEVRHKPVAAPSFSKNAEDPEPSANMPWDFADAVQRRRLLGNEIERPATAPARLALPSMAALATSYSIDSENQRSSKTSKKRSLLNLRSDVEKRPRQHANDATSSLSASERVKNILALRPERSKSAPPGLAVRPQPQSTPVQQDEMQTQSANQKISSHSTPSLRPMRPSVVRSPPQQQAIQEPYTSSVSSSRQFQVWPKAPRAKSASVNVEKATSKSSADHIAPPQTITPITEGRRDVSFAENWCTPAKLTKVSDDHGSDFGARNEEDILRFSREFWRKPISADVEEKLQNNGRIIRIDQSTGTVGIAGHSDDLPGEVVAITLFKPGLKGKKPGQVSHEAQLTKARDYFDNR